MGPCWRRIPIEKVQTVETELIPSWLRRKTRAEAWASLVGGLVFLALAGLVLSFVAGLASATFISFLRFLRSSGAAPAWTSGQVQAARIAGFLFSLLVLLVLFWTHSRTVRQRRSRLAPTPEDDVSTVPTMPERPDLARELLQEAIFAGPRLTLTALDWIQKSRRLLALDVVMAGRVLGLLARHRSRLSFREIGEAIPELEDREAFTPLQDIVGIVFLNSEPAGLSLTQDLRAELRDVLGEPVRPMPRTLPFPPGWAPTSEASGESSKAPPQTPATTSSAEWDRAYQTWIDQAHSGSPSTPKVEPEPAGPESTDEIYQEYRRLLKRNDPSRPT